MSDTSIQVSEETKARLDRHRRDGESYEEVILRLTERDEWTGFGVLSDAESDTSDGVARIRSEFRENVADDVEETG
jgi:predicted CopG family antitoxin